jgi:hypothetical protein
MKRTTIFLLLLVCLIPVSIMCVSNVSAYNYDPGVNVGDEIVYTFNSTSPTYQDVTHLKINVTTITDGVNVTVIDGYIDFSEDGGVNYGYETGATELAILQDYSPNPEVIFDDLQFFIVPGTKIGDFTADIQALLTSGTATSIERGYGMEISGSMDINRIQVYDKNGILTKLWNNDTYIYEANILSINGETYTPPVIPGYPTLFVVGFMLLGIIGIYLVKMHKKTR